MKLDDDSSLVQGGLYNLVYEVERLVYLGKSGCWYEFAEVDSAPEVYCRLLEGDLEFIEATKFEVQKS